MSNTARKTTTKSDTPAPVGLNLDTVDVPDDVDPFPITYKGKRVEMTHADLLDGFDFLNAFMKGEAEATHDLLELALGDDIKTVRGWRLPTYRLNAITKGYLAHCGMVNGAGDPGN